MVLLRCLTQKLVGTALANQNNERASDGCSWGNSSDIAQMGEHESCFTYRAICLTVDISLTGICFGFFALRLYDAHIQTTHTMQHVCVCIWSLSYPGIILENTFACLVHKVLTEHGCKYIHGYFPAVSDMSPGYLQRGTRAFSKLLT